MTKKFGEEFKGKNYLKQYNQISKKTNMDLEKFFMIRNYKSQTPISPNIVSQIKDINKAIVIAKDDKNLEKSFEILLSIDGIALPTASALLHFAYPNKYPIIDKYVYSAMKDKKRNLPYTKNKLKTTKVYKEYLKYVKKHKGNNSITIFDRNMMIKGKKLSSP